MNNIPQIIVNSGFDVDQNGNLVELVIPSNVSTLKAPSKVTFMGGAINYLPSLGTALTEISAPNCSTIPATICTNCTLLTKASFPSVTALAGGNSNNGSGEFYGCTSLHTINFNSLITMGVQYKSQTGAFFGCTSLTTVNLPKLAGFSGSPVSSCGAFYGCTSLENVTFGSEGHAVSNVASYTFGGCTQAGLTITIYTTGGASLSGSPWGATNATIVYEEA